MKTILTILILLTVFSLNTFAQDYTQFLPEGAKTRLGKGYKTGVSIFSEDGTRFAVSSSIGLWIYDVFTGQEDALLTNHQSEFTVLAVSPDGGMLASANENTISLFQLHTGLWIAQLTEHSENITTLVFSPDGEVLSSASEDNTVRLWDSTSGKLLFLPLREHTGDVISIAFSPDSTMLASGSTDNTVRLWSATTGEHLATLEEQIKWGTVTHEGHTGDVTAVAFSSDGTTLASGGTDNKIRLWDVGAREHRTAISGHSERVTALAFSPDSTILASGSTDNTIRLWNPSTHRHLETLEGHRYHVITLAFSMDGAILASGDYGGNVLWWDGNTGQFSGRFQLGSKVLGIEYPVRAIAFSNNGETLASGHGHTNLRTYQYNNPSSVFDGHCPGVYRYYTGRYHSYRGSIWLWNPLIGGEYHSNLSSNEYSSITYVPTGSKVKVSWDWGFVHALAFSPDDKILASAEEKSFLYENYCGVLDLLEDNEYFLRFWSVDTGDHLFTREGHDGPITSVAFSTGNKILASGSWDDTVRLWNPTTGQHLTTFHGHWDNVNSVTFSPDGETLASGSTDGTIILWNPDGQIRARLNEGGHVESVAFSPDGKILASGSINYTIKLWNPTTAKHILTLEGHTDWVRSVAFSPDGATLASASDDRTIRLWDSATGQHLATLSGHKDYVYSVAFSPDGTTLASGSGDCTILLWDVEPAVSQNPLDVNKDGVVNILDLTTVASNFGKTGENPADVNGDGVVNVSDIVLVAGALDNEAAAPSTYPQVLTIFTATDVKRWLTQAQQLNLTDPTSQRGILFLEQLLAALTPKKTVLLSNYPNPFNPETWIPYQLANPADVMLTIYASDGTVVRTLSLGHQPVGIYQGKNRAAHWDGKNAHGEPVASGVYFYTLTAGEFSATRKMLIRK